MNEETFTQHIDTVQRRLETLERRATGLPEEHKPLTLEALETLSSALENLHVSQEALRESEQRFRLFFENAPEYSYMVSPEGIILDVNAAALGALGYDKEELVGKAVSTIYAPEYLPKMQELFAAWRESGTLRDEEAVVVTKYGERRTVLLSAGMVRDQDGQVVHSISMQRDITDRLRLQEALRRARKMESVGRLAGGVAHQYNNFLAAILGFADLLRLEMDPSDPLQEYAAKSSSAGQRAASITRQLMAYSRIRMLQLTRLNLNALISRLETSLRDLLGESTNVETHLAPDLHPIEADPGELQQAILALVTNARDAMPRGGRLTITTENTCLDEQQATALPEARDGAYVCLTLEDTGVGMDAETLDRIFEPFFTTRSLGEGIGLGLSVAYGIVAQHEGWISVESERGHGSTFRVYLPAAPESPVSSPRPIGATEES